MVSICRQSNFLLLSSIFLVSLFLRIWGINFGLPYQYHYDEPFFIMHALKFGTGDLNPHWFLYPTLQMYLLFFLYALLFVLGRVVGVFHSTYDLAILYFTDPSAFYLIGRFATAVFGVLTVAMVYVIGRRFFNSRVGILASWFLVFSFLHVENSHYIKPDVQMTFLVVLSFYYSARILQKGATSDYVLAGMIGGFAVSTKYPAIFIFVPLVIAHLLRGSEEQGNFRKLIVNRKLLLATVIMGVGFFLGTPFALLDFKHFFQSVIGFQKSFRKGFLGFSPTNTWLAIVTEFLPEGLGVWLEVLCLVGLIYGLCRRTKEDILLGSFPLVYTLVMGNSKLNISRYWIPVLPFLVIFGARLLNVVIVRTMLLRERFQSVVFILIAFLLVVPTGLQSVRFDYLLTQKDTRTIAKEWIESNIAPETRIALDAGIVPLSQNRASLREEWRCRLQEADQVPEARSHASQSLLEVAHTKNQYYELRLKMAVLEPSYYAVKLTPIGSKSLDYYENNGFKYIVINGGTRRLYLRERARYPDTAAFYEGLDSKYPLVKVFQPNPVNRPGPDIYIYKLD